MRFILPCVTLIQIISSQSNDPSFQEICEAKGSGHKWDQIELPKQNPKIHYEGCLMMNDDSNTVDGPGTLTYFNPNQPVYTGYFKNGLKHGNGKQVWPSGKIEEGEWKKNVKDGPMVITFPHGGKFVGFYKNDKAHGSNCTYEDDTGYSYKGDFEDGKKHGKGVRTWPDTCENNNPEWCWEHKAGGSYHGEFEEGKQSGKGIFNFANGDFYIGQFKSDLFHGQGKFCRSTSSQVNDDVDLDESCELEDKEDYSEYGEDLSIESSMMYACSCGEWKKGENRKFKNFFKKLWKMMKFWEKRSFHKMDHAY